MVGREMNANELANKLADEVDIHVAMGGSTFFKEVSTMLRQFGLAESIIKQQQLEIAQLKVAYEQEQYRSKQWQERFESGRLT
jgi:hypothetical protein